MKSEQNYAVSIFGKHTNMATGFYTQRSVNDILETVPNKIKGAVFSAVENSYRNIYGNEKRISKKEIGQAEVISPYLIGALSQLNKLKNDPNTPNQLNLSPIKQMFNSIDTSTLSDEQTKIIKQLSQSNTYINMISGVAGGGKSYLLHTIIEQLNYQYRNANSIPLYMLAPTHVAVNNLRVATTDYDDSNYPVPFSTTSSFYTRNIRPQGNIVNTKAYVPKSILVIDEVFAVSPSLLVPIITWAIEHQAYILLIGDPNQLPAIGDDVQPFLAHILKQGFATMTSPLKINQRAAQHSKITQTANDIVNKAPLSHIVPASVDQVIHSINNVDAAYVDLSQIGGRNAGLNKVAEIYHALTTTPEHKRASDTVILTAVHVDREELNARLHNDFVAKRKANNDTSNGVPISKDNPIFIGEPIITQNTLHFSSNLNDVLRGGTMYTVTDTKLQPSNPKESSIGFANDFESEYRRLTESNQYDNELEDAPVETVGETLDYAYATTTHKVQGSSIQNVIVYLPKQYLGHFKNNALYSALTRARKRIILMSTPDVIRNTVMTPHVMSPSAITMLEKIQNEVDTPKYQDIIKLCSIS